jgi:peptidyl-prolyl cis-trans isomerase SurA
MLLALVPSWGETVVEIAAVVNDEIITSYQLEQKRQALAQEAVERGLTMPQDLRQEALDILIDEALMRQRAKELGVEVSEEDIDAAIADIQRQNQLSLEQLTQALAAQGISMKKYRANIKEQIRRYRVIGQDVQSRAEVGSEQIRNYFREHIDDYRQAPLVRLSHLAVIVGEGASAAQIEAARQKAQDALRRIRSGEEFAEVFISLSGDADVSGGDMGTFAQGELAPRFDEAVRQLEEGQVSEVIEMAGNFYLLKVEEKKPGQIRKYDEVKEEIRQLLLEEGSRGRLEQWHTELRQKAYIDIRTVH